MDRHAIIVIIASFVIAAPSVFAGWNIYAVEQIQLVGFEQEQFSYFDIINDGGISICNPLPFYVTFNKIDVTMMLDQTSKGTFSIQNVVLPPSDVTDFEGIFRSENFQEAQYLALHFDGMFGSGLPVRIDPSKFAVVTETHVPIMGMIPYSVTKQYSGWDFWNMMNTENGEFRCE